MSIQNSLVKTYMRLTNYKSRGDRLTLVERQINNLPDPPEKVKRQISFEKFMVDEAKAVWLGRENRRNGVLVYLHGGSYYAGPFKQQWEYFSDICRQTKMAGILVDYRLAPQNPFPDGLNDVLIILETLRRDGETNENYFLLGDSAGAGLAAATVFRLKEMNAPLPKKIILMSGWFDASGENPDIQKSLGDDPMLSFARLLESGKTYAGEHDLKNVLISPIFGDLKNFPPTLMQCGTADLLVWENRKFYQKCLDAGVAVKYEEYENAFHCFMMVGFLPEARAARKSQTEFLLSSKGHS